MYFYVVKVELFVCSHAMYLSHFDLDKDACVCAKRATKLCIQRISAILNKKLLFAARNSNSKSSNIRVKEREKYIFLM